MSNLCCVVWRHPIVVAFLSKNCDTRWGGSRMQYLIVISIHAFFGDLKQINLSINYKPIFLYLSFTNMSIQ